jgi:hypothetical protein
MPASLMIRPFAQEIGFGLGETLSHGDMLPEAMVVQESLNQDSMIEIVLDE